MEEWTYRLSNFLALAGTIAHIVYFNDGEHHMSGVRYLRTFLGCTAISWLVLYLYGHTWTHSIQITLMITAHFLSGLYTSLLIYRLFVTPLRRFRGPWWAKISSLGFSFQLRKWDAHKQLLALHQKYGDFVRIGSSDLSIIHPQAVKAIYGQGSQCIKSDFYDLSAPVWSLQTTRKRIEHDERRRLWGPAFSGMAVQGYGRKIAKYQDQLIARIAEQGTQSVNVQELFMFYNFDVMGDLAFGESFNMLQDNKLHWAVKLLQRGIEPLGWMFPSWCFRTLLAIPGATGDWYAFMDYCYQRLDEKLQCSDVQVPDILSYLLKPWREGKQTDFDKRMLQGDSQLIVVAGSDTTASTLTAIFYELAQRPQIVSRLRDELKHCLGTSEDIFDTALQSSNLLNGIINEALRLYPPASFLQRKTPPEGLTIGETFVPGNMTVFCPFYVAGRSEDIYIDATSFRPERWYDAPDMIKEPSAYAPFSTGVYNCIGKPIALLNLRTTIAKLLLNFDVTFAETENGTAFHNEMRTTFITSPGSLNLKFTRIGRPVSALMY